MTDHAASPVDSPAFQAWLGQALGIGALAIADVRSPSGGGWSNETCLFTASDRAAPARERRRLVLRLAPSGAAMFPAYDLARQVACMRALRAVAGCPVPEIVADDAAGTVIGRPLYVMAFVAGQIPPDDRPTFFEAGFLFDAAPRDQARFHHAMLAALAGLHAVEVPGDLRAMLSRAGGGTALGRETAWLRGVFDWGRGPGPQDVIARALDRIDASLPDDGRAVLLWGDARPANVVVRDFAPAALLDWELATLGPPEMDLFWLLEMNRMRGNGANLPGFPGWPEAIADYEELSGTKTRDAAWHTLFAATKVAVLMLRHLRVRVAEGLLPEGHKILTGNVATRRLEALLDGSAPAAGG